MKSEPAGTIGSTISGILVALFLILQASGVMVANDLEAGITALIIGVLAIPAVSGWATRFFVVAPDTAGKAIVAAHRADPALPLPPAARINVPGVETGT